MLTMERQMKKMKYNIQMISEIAEKDRDFIFFWGHRAPKVGGISESCLSQWWKCDFYEDKKLFNCAEQYMMYRKAILFQDYETAHYILRSENPKEIKALGRKVKNFEEIIWDKNKEKIVEQANLLKFSQNPNLKDFLLLTNEKILVEASPTDKIWGIGLKKETDGINNPKNWNGLNLLGFILMEVRDKIK